MIEDILHRLTQGETLHEYPAQLRCKDGSIRDVLINSNVLWEDNRFVHTRCFTRDITERKKIEEDVRRRTAQFETLLNEAPLGVYLVDGNFRIRQVNPMALHAFGDIPDLIGRDFAEVIRTYGRKHMLKKSLNGSTTRSKRASLTSFPSVSRSALTAR